MTEPTIPLLKERFELHEKIGEGAAGLVMRATDRTTGDKVAIKLLHQVGVERERVAREIEALRRLSHPGIVAFVCDGVDEHGVPFLAMEWVDGQNLAERKDPTRLPDAVCLELVAQAAEAAGKAHQTGIVHRDLKPGNILLVPGDPPRIKLVDFGLAIFAEASTFTRPGALVGTPNYMAPEQVRGSREVDGRADLYALGAVLFELVTGVPPFEGDTPVAILVKVVLEEPTRLKHLRPDISPAVEEVVARALRKRPEDRYQSGREMAQALRAAIRGDGATTRKKRLGAPRVVAVMLSSGGETAVEIAVENGALADRLTVGPVVATFGLGRTHGDETVRAARTAMRIRARHGHVRMAIASGLAHVSEGTVAGEVIDAAVALLGRARPGEILVDSESVGVLGERFELQPARSGRALGAERMVPAVRRVVGVVTPTLGRDQELRQLVELHDLVARERRPRAALVIGAAGMGKSRLLAELLRHVGNRGAPSPVLSCRGDPVRARAFAALALAFRRSTGLLDGDPLPAQRALLETRLRRCLSGKTLASAAVYLGELAGISEDAPIPHELESARANPGVLHREIRRALGALIQGEATDRPFILVIEDLQWVDHDTVKTMGWVRDAVEAPALILGLTRPESAQVGWTALGGQQSLKLELSPLSIEVTEELARLTLGDRVDGTRIRKIAARAGGNPLFLEEMVRAVARGEGARGKLPTTVQAIVQAQLDRLGPDARQACKLASVFGMVFWDRALGDLASALPELLEDEIVEARRQTRFAGSVEYVFRNVPTQEGAYELVDASDRPRLHRHARKWLVGAGEKDPTVLAHHAASAADHADAAELYGSAAEAALDAGFFAVAVRFASSGLTHADSGQNKARLHLLRARAQRRLGGGGTLDHDAAIAAATLPVGSVDHAQAVWEIASTLRAQGRMAEALREVESALSAPSVPPAGQVLLQAQRAYLLADLGRLDESTELATLACEIAEREGRTGTEEYRRALAARAHALSHHPDLSRALAAHEALVREAIESDDPLVVATARANAGFVLSCLGRYKEAIAALEEAERVARSIDARTVIGFVLENQAVPLARAGRAEEGIEKARAALDIGEEQQEPRLVAAASMALANLLIERGGPDDVSLALKLAARAQSAAEPFPSLFSDARAVRARAFLAAGNAPAARTLITGATGGLPNDTSAERRELVMLVEIETLMALGRDEDAEHALREAYRALDARLGAIGRPSDRESVRTNVPEHRRILELYAERLGSERDTLTETVRDER